MIFFQSYKFNCRPTNLPVLNNALIKKSKAKFWIVTGAILALVNTASVPFPVMKFYFKRQ